jgi:hypothetical protein
MTSHRGVGNFTVEQAFVLHPHRALTTPPWEPGPPGELPRSHGSPGGPGSHGGVRRSAVADTAPLELDVHAHGAGGALHARLHRAIGTVAHEAEVPIHVHRHTLLGADHGVGDTL